MTIYEELKWRGLVADCTDSAALDQRLEAGPTVLYAASILLPTASMSETWSRCSLCAGFNCTGTMPLRWRAARRD